MPETVLVTGATSGIGYATALLFGKNGYNLILCGRREDRLKNLEGQLDGLCKCTSLTFDVRDKQAVSHRLENLPAGFKEIDILINNAGNAHGLQPIHQGDIEDWEAMIDINVKGLLYVTRAILPNMVKKKKGHIINVGSIAGREIYPNGNVYSATKFAVHALSESMRVDLNAHGIKVSEIKPGAVETEFSEVRFKGDKEKAKKVYEGFHPLSAEDIAEVIYFMATRPPHVNVADLMVLPSAQASAARIHRDTSAGS